MTHTESVQQVRAAANNLAKACQQQTLRSIYQGVVKEGVPEWAQELLNRMK